MPSDARFEVVHIDLVGPLPVSQGFKYLLTCVDRFTSWPEAFPLIDIMAESVAHAFVLDGLHTLVYQLSLLLIEESSHSWNHLRSILGIHRQRTTAYHPAANGMVEHFHKSSKPH